MAEENKPSPKALNVKSAAKAATAKAASGSLSQENQERVAKVADTAHKAQMAGAVGAKGLAAAKAGIGGGAAALGNPITWIIIALVIIILLGITVYQVLGRNENADGCYGIGDTSGVNVGDAGDSWEENAPMIADWLTTTNFEALGGQPMSVEQAAGVIGNMRQESSVLPTTVQAGRFESDVSNQFVIDLGSGNGGQAIGLIQWDSDRRYELANWVDSRGGHWSDLDLQLEFLKLELEGTGPTGTYNRDQVLAHGFDDPNETVEHYTEAWELGFTRAGKPMLENRIEYAHEFLDMYSPGNNGSIGSGRGGACLRNSGGADMSDAIALAVSMSYPTEAESRVPSGDPWGQRHALPAYVEAKREAEATAGGPDPMGDLYASCDRLVATVVRLFMDPNMPWGATQHQYQYLESHPDWQRYDTKSEAEPGDVWVTTGPGHIVLYLGDVDGRDMISHASYMDRVAGLGNAGWFSENLVDGLGRPYAGYRWVGPTP